MLWNEREYFLDMWVSRGLEKYPFLPENHVHLSVKLPKISLP